MEISQLPVLGNGAMLLVLFERTWVRDFEGKCGLVGFRGAETGKVPVHYSVLRKYSN